MGSASDFAPFRRSNVGVARCSTCLKTAQLAAIRTIRRSTSGLETTTTSFTSRLRVQAPGNRHHRPAERVDCNRREERGERREALRLHLSAIADRSFERRFALSEQSGGVALT
jgi:hypothetical protein